MSPDFEKLLRTEMFNAIKENLAEQIKDESESPIRKLYIQDVGQLISYLKRFASEDFVNSES